MRTTIDTPRARPAGPGSFSPARIALLGSAIAGLVACSSASTSSSPADAGDAAHGRDSGAVDAAKDAASASRTDGRADASGDVGVTATPSLSSLSVKITSPPSAAAATLVPSFSPDIHDYSVRCGAGTNAFTVTMQTAPDAKAAVVQPTPSPAASSQTVNVSVDTGAALVVAATSGTASVEYWVRCLPLDFPSLLMTPHPDAGAVTPGYYLVGNTTAPLESSAYAMVLDTNGVPVWYDAVPSRGVFNVSTVVPGVISFIGPTSGLSYENHQLDPLQTTFVRSGSVTADEHELQLLPNGDFVIFTGVFRTADLTGLTLPLRQGGTVSFGPDTTYIDCLINELTPSGTVVWTWDAADHFDLIEDMSYPSPPEQTAPPYVVEPFHCNAIDVDANGNLLISARHMNSVFYVERPSGKVLWKMGGSSYSTDGAAYVPVADPFVAQHDARFNASWQSTCSGRSGSGQISLFDDESSISASIVSTLPARGVVYDVNVAAPGCDDAGTPSATVAWQYAGTEPVSATGSFRVLPEGGGIVGWGTIPGFVFSEVDTTGHDRLDLKFLDGACSYRAIKVPLTALDLGTMRATAGENGQAVTLPATDAGLDAAGGADGGAEDATAPDASFTSCHAVTGSGASEQCSFTSSSAPGYTCASDGGGTAGSCSSVGLYGCCVEAQVGDMGITTITAACYYSSATGQPASTECATNAYDGLPYEWQTTAP